jgi:hypothetical protein
MSDKNYSPEPWHYTGMEDGDFMIWAGEGFVGNVGAAMQQCGVIIDLDIGNARRIVACVNALRGVPNEALEEAATSGKYVGTLEFYQMIRDKREVAEKQRDRLLDLLAEIVAADDMSRDALTKMGLEPDAGIMALTEKARTAVNEIIESYNA